MPHKFLMLMPFLLLSFDQPRMMKVKVAADITITVPKDWRPMDGLDFSERYPSVRAPLAAYTNANRTADFSVNISATRWPDANLQIASQFFKASLTNLFDRIHFIDEGIREVNGQRFIYFCFESRMNGRRDDLSNREPILKYSCMQYLVQPHRTLVFSFHCDRRERQDWEETADTMLKAIRVK